MRDAARVFRVLRGRYPKTMLEGWAGERFSPYRHLVGTILSARVRDETTDALCRRLFRRYPSPASLAAASPREVEPLIRASGYFRQKARYIVATARKLLRDHGGVVPRTLEELLEFPGVGRKVANCVLVYAFGQPAIAVDTHVHRVSNRLGWVRTRTPERTERALVRLLPRAHWLEINELMVAHGKAVCRPVGPRCGECRIARWCRRVGVAQGRRARRLKASRT